MYHQNCCNPLFNEFDVTFAWCSQTLEAQNNIPIKTYCSSYFLLVNVVDFNRLKEFSWGKKSFSCLQMKFSTLFIAPEKLCSLLKYQSLLLSPRILISHLRREIRVIFQNWMSFLQLTGDKVKARRSKSLDKTATWVQAQNEALTTSSDRRSNQTQTESVSRKSNQMQTEVCCQRSFIQRVYRKIYNKWIFVLDRNIGVIDFAGPNKCKHTWGGTRLLKR